MADSFGFGEAGVKQQQVDLHVQTIDERLSLGQGVSGDHGETHLHQLGGQGKQIAYVVIEYQRDARTMASLGERRGNIMVSHECAGGAKLVPFNGNRGAERIAAQYTAADTEL